MYYVYKIDQTIVKLSDNYLTHQNKNYAVKYYLLLRKSS
jgi:hypothetical protein